MFRKEEEEVGEGRRRRKSLDRLEGSYQDLRPRFELLCGDRCPERSQEQALLPERLLVPQSSEIASRNFKYPYHFHDLLITIIDPQFFHDLCLFEGEMNGDIRTGSKG